MHKPVITLENHSWWPYLLPYVLVPMQHIGMIYGGWGSWSAFLFAFVIIPLLDHFVGLDFANPTKDQARALSQKLSFRLITWIWVPLQTAFLFRGMHIVLHRPMSTFELAGAVIAGGLGAGGLGINIAHELIHKPNYFEQLLGRILLAETCYGHFYVEHLQGHHKRVSTREDPATSRLGESFYAFWVRTITGSFKSAWDIEAARLGQAGKSAWSLENEVLKLHLGSASIGALCFWWEGIWGLWFFLTVSFVGVTMLELVNYIEHYGLERRIDPVTGQPSRVTPMHSWNAGYKISNFLLFKLQRHSDHHANAGRRYQVLRTFENSPQLPQGYPAMVLVAMVPPLWFYIMDGRVMQYRKKTAEYERLGIDMFPELTAHAAEDKPGR